MTIRRAIFLVLGAALALFVGLYYGSDFYPRLEAALHPMPAPAKPLDGENSISNLTVRQTKPREWTADFDYYYTGDPPSAKLRIDLLPRSGSSSGRNAGSAYRPTRLARSVARTT